MIIKKSFLKKIYKKRKAWTHKGKHGKLLVIGGSNIYVGAPLFVALAALRSGCDLVYVAAPQRAANIIARTPDLITYQLNGNHLAKRHVKQLLKMSKNMDAIVIGNGLGNNKDTLSAINNFFSKCSLPTVLDADAIRASASNKKLLKGRIITPHAGEFFLLTGKSVSNELELRKKYAKTFASKYKCIVLLKGHIDVITDGNKVAINKTGSPKLTVGGTGDTLAGICGALLARGTGAFDAACAAAYVNGKAGEYAVRRYGESTIASDLVEEISNVLKPIIRY